MDGMHERSNRYLRRNGKAVGLVLAIVILSLAVQIADAAAPTLTQLSPPGGQRGTKVTVDCKGKFDWPVSVVVAGVDVVAATDKGKLDITIPDDLAADRIWIRLHNAEGASNAVPFLIGSLKEISEQEPNNSPQKAQKLAEAAVTINGVLEKKDVDGFAVELTSGQTLVAALDANTRLGSPMDAILQIATPDGFVVAENHDDVGLDPRLAFTPKTPGTYIVRVFAFPSTPDSTIAFRGGDDYVYRLTVTTGPYITHAVPMSVWASEPGTVEVFGWNIPPGTKLPVVPVPLGDAAELEPLDDARLSPETRPALAFSPDFGGAARVRLVPFSVIPSLAPSDEKNPLPLPVSGAATGRLQLPRQTDFYRLPLTKGQPIVIVAEARELDFPLDPVLQLLDPAGKSAASFDDPSPKKSPIISHTPSQDGDYVLTIRDRYRKGSERSFYRLTVRKEESDFELTASADALVVTPDKPAELTVNVKRRGSGVGPVTIEAIDLPPGVAAPAVVSEPKGDTSGKVKLSFTTTGPAFSGRIRISGTIKEPQEIKRLARTPVNLGASFESFWLTAIEKP